MDTPRASPRQKRSRDTYERVLDVAAKIFGELGYAGTTTNKIAEAAGISIGTLYHYIPDKDALLASLTERHLASGAESIMAAFGRLREQQPGLEESLREVIEMSVRMHVEEPHLHRLLYDSAPRSEELQKRLREADAAVADEVAWHLERLGVANRDRALVASMLVAGVEAQVHRALIDADEPADPGLVSETLTRLWLRALEGS
jgi:AcrR family transcriptional regulator